MSGREWKSGDVARIVLANGVVHEVAVRLPLHEGGWATGTTPFVHSVHVVTARRLVVIDPEDTGAIDRLLTAYHAQAGDRRDRSLRHMSAALRSLIEPPKPDEPTGLGAVVEEEGGKSWSGFDAVRVPSMGIEPLAEWERDLLRGES